jgi:hypothetical protein
MSAYIAASAVFFHEGPRFISPVLWGVPMTYRMVDQGTPSEYPVVERSLRSYEVLGGPLIDPDVAGVVWYRVDILAEGFADIPEAWLPLRPGSQDMMGFVA